MVNHTVSQQSVKLSLIPQTLIYDHVPPLFCGQATGHKGSEICYHIYAASCVEEGLQIVWRSQGRSSHVTLCVSRLGAGCWRRNKCVCVPTLSDRRSKEADTGAFSVFTYIIRQGQDSIGDPAYTATSARDRRFATSAGELVWQPLFRTVIDYTRVHFCGRECKQN